PGDFRTTPSPAATPDEPTAHGKLPGSAAPRTRDRQSRGDGRDERDLLHVGLHYGLERRADPAPEGAVHAELRAGDAGAVHLLRRVFRDVAAFRQGGIALRISPQ